MTFEHRTEELIAIGAAVGANCSGCLEYHLAQARKAGLDEADIAGAIEVGKAVRKGAASQIDKVAAKLRGGEVAGATLAPRACCS